MIPGIQKLLSPKAMAFLPLLGMTNKQLVDLSAQELGAVVKAASTVVPLPKSVVATVEALVSKSPDVTVREMLEKATVKQLTETVLTQYAAIQAEMPVETTVDMIQDCSSCGQTIVRKGVISGDDGAIQLKKCDCPHCKTPLEGM